MKKMIYLVCTAILGFTFYSCASTPSSYSKPTEYKEFSENEVLSKDDFQRKADNGISGMKLLDARFRIENSDNDIKLKVNGFYVNYSEFCNVNPDFFAQIEDGKKYTVYLSYIKEGSFLDGYTYKPILDNVEGLRSIEEINKENQLIEEDRLAKEREVKELTAKKEKKLKSKLAELSQNYVIHGADEAENNAILFNNGALESGHAYYVESFLIKAGGELWGAVTGLFSIPEYRYIKYVNQNVRGEVTSAGSESILGTTPVSVIIAGGKAPGYVPVILCIVE